MSSAATHHVVGTRAPLAGAGYVDDVRECFEAVAQAVDALGGDPGLVLIFPTGASIPRTPRRRRRLPRATRTSSG